MAAAPQPLALVELVMDKLGIERNGRATGATALARHLGWETAQTQQDLRRWREGSLPNYYETWALLDAVGWIKTEESPLESLEEFVRRLDAGEPVTKRERERVARLVERVEATVHLLAEKIRADAQASRKG